MKKSNDFIQPLEIQAYIKKDFNNIPQFYVRGWGSAFELLVDRYLEGDEVELSIEIQPSYDRKTITEKQRGYIFGGLGPVVEQMLRDSGYVPYDTKQAIDIIKTHPDVDFTRKSYNEQGELVSVPLSLSDDAAVPRRLIRQFIDRVFLLLSEEGYHPVTPAEYKKGLRWRRALKK